MNKLTERISNILYVVEEYQQEIEHYGLEKARLLHNYNEAEIINELKEVLVELINENKT